MYYHGLSVYFFFSFSISVLSYSSRTSVLVSGAYARGEGDRGLTPPPLDLKNILRGLGGLGVYPPPCIRRPFLGGLLLVREVGDVR